MCLKTKTHVNKIHVRTHVHTHTQNTKTPFIGKKECSKIKGKWLENIFSANITKVTILVKVHLQRGKNKSKTLREKQAKGHEKLIHKKGHSNTEK